MKNRNTHGRTAPGTIAGRLALGLLLAGLLAACDVSESVPPAATTAPAATTVPAATTAPADPQGAYPDPGAYPVPNAYPAP
jgi:hypothetical protein